MGDHEKNRDDDAEATEDHCPRSRGETEATPGTKMKAYSRTTEGSFCFKSYLLSMTILVTVLLPLLMISMAAKTD